MWSNFWSSPVSKQFRVLETILIFRLNCIQDAENKKALMTAKRIEGAQQIMDQIKRNEEARILEEERKNAEQGKLMKIFMKTNK